MTIQVLVCRPDGSQEIMQKEVPDDWYVVPEPETGKEMEHTDK